MVRKQTNETVALGGIIKFWPILALVFSLGSSFFGYYVTTELDKVRDAANLQVERQKQLYELDQRDLKSKFEMSQKEVDAIKEELQAIEKDLKALRDDYESYKNFMAQEKNK